MKSKFAAILVMGALVGASGCASRTTTFSNMSANPSQRPDLISHAAHDSGPTVFYEEGHVDTEPCCGPLDDWMPPLFGSVRPRARIPMDDVPMF